MAEDEKERELRKKAIFDSMSRRGQERILRMGYENWDPFQEPKDPRERIHGSASVQANALVREFFRSRGEREPSPAFQKELFELCRGLLKEEARAKTLFDFCNWYRRRAG